MDGFEPNRTLMLWSENFVVPLFCPVPVQFTEVPQNITVNTSTPTVLNCDATGFPEPKIRWEKSGIHLCGTKQLKISSINTNDAGEYICIASNGVRQEKTVRAYVAVQCKSLFQHYECCCLQVSWLELQNTYNQVFFLFLIISTILVVRSNFPAWLVTVTAIVTTIESMKVPLTSSILNKYLTF